MKIAFIDRDMSERNKALPILMNGFQDHNLCVQRFDFFDSGEAFLENWTVDAYDLVIMDIYLGGMTGVDVANRIREKNKETRIVFCSASNEFASESYDVNACYYIRKPINDRAVRQMIARLNIEDFELRRFLTLPDGQRLVLRNMVYAEYHNHRIRIATRNRQDLSLRTSHSAFAQLCSPYDFFYSCNSGCVINLYEVIDMEKDAFLMSDGCRISISRRKKADAKIRYQTFLTKA